MSRLATTVSVPALLFIVLAHASVAADNAPGAHDPCIIRDGEHYYLFTTGGGLRIRRSKDLITWEPYGRVFDDVPPWAVKVVPDVKSLKGLWAPDISFFHGEYHLYYAISTYGTNHSCIGLATNRTLDSTKPNYRWVDRGMVINSLPNRDNWNAIDPNVILEPNGQPWLAFGSYRSGIKLCRLERGTGKRADDKLIPLARRPEAEAVEAPFLIRHGDHYYLLVSFDKCCKGVDSNYKIMVGRSRALTGPYVDRAGRPMMAGGGTLVLAGYGRYRGPGHNAILQDKDADWLVHHFYDAKEDGRPTLQIRPLVWASDGWPLAGEPFDGVQRPNQPSPIGTWRHSVNFGEANTITLRDGGRIGRPPAERGWISLCSPQMAIPTSAAINRAR